MAALRHLRRNRPADFGDLQFSEQDRTDARVSRRDRHQAPARVPRLRGGDSGGAAEQPETRAPVDGRGDQRRRHRDSVGRAAMVTDSMTLTPGYEALTHGAALVDLSSRGRIRVTGEDRARLLHAMTTNHVQQLKPGEGLYAFFLNAQGRILADACVLCFEDHLLLDTEPETRTVVYQHLDRYIIADDVTLEDVTDETFCLGIEGPRALYTALAA